MSLSAQIRQDARRRRHGFTLVELLAVMLIITVLAGLVLGIAGLANRKMAEAETRTEMEQIKSLLEEYRLEYGQYPLRGNSDTKAAMTSNWFETLHEDVLTNYYDRVGLAGGEVDFRDAWDRSYWYSRDKDARLQYRIWSFGRDGIDETADDITNWRGN